MRIKNSFLIGLTLLLAVGILAVSVVRVAAVTQSQNYKIAPIEKTSAGKVATQTAQKRVDYFLAYPGLLPDHPLYFLKMIRDRVWLGLTTNPLKKAELLLLFADKRLGAAKALIEGNKVELGVSTVTKAEKYLQRAVSQEASGRGKEDTRALLEKLSLAASKHEEVLLGLQEKVSGEAKGVLETALALTRQCQAQIKQALSE